MYYIMYKFSRNNLRESKIFTIKWFENNKYKFNDVTKSILRTTKFTIDINHYYKIVNNIEFIYNDIDCHWAETDGETIWINIWNDTNRWNQSLLNYTVAHECIHGLIKRHGKHYTTEYKEHIIMSLIDPLLV
jgi:hypothetical protein